MNCASRNKFWPSGLLLTTMLLLAPCAFAGGIKHGFQDCGTGIAVDNKNKTFASNAVLGVGAGWYLTSSSGSSNTSCRNDIVRYDNNQQLFVAASFDHLSHDMAQGHGQYLVALVDMLGCPADSNGSIGRIAQEGYAFLIPVENDSAALLANLKREMQGHPALASACTRLT